MNLFGMPVLYFIEFQKCQLCMLYFVFTFDFFPLILRVNVEPALASLPTTHNGILEDLYYL